MLRLPNPESLDRFSASQVRVAQLMIETFTSNPSFDGFYTEVELVVLRDIGANALATECYMEITICSPDHIHANSEDSSEKLKPIMPSEAQQNITGLVIRRLRSGRIF